MLAAEALAEIAQRGVLQQVRQAGGRVEYGIGVYGEAVDVAGGEFFLVVDQDVSIALTRPRAPMCSP